MTIKQAFADTAQKRRTVLLCLAALIKGGFTRTLPVGVVPSALHLIVIATMVHPTCRISATNIRQHGQEVPLPASDRAALTKLACPAVKSP